LEQCQIKKAIKFYENMKNEGKLTEIEEKLLKDDDMKIFNQ